MPTYINNLCSAPYSLTGASGYKPLLTLEDIAAAIQELTALQNQLQCCTQTEKDAEVIVLTATPSGTAPNYDWSAEIRLNTCFFAGDVLTVDLTGIPNNFTLDSISPITPATVLINISAKTLVFTGTVLAGTYFVISGTFDDNVCAAGTATLTIAGDTVTSNNVAITTYSGANWCVLKDTLVDTDNNANGYGCNSGVLVYPFSIDLTARGGTKVAVTSDADIIAAYAALPIPIAVTISGCDILLPNGETPTNIEIECIKVVLYSDGVSLPAAAITNTATNFIITPNIVTTGTVGGGVVTGQAALYDEFGAVVYPLQSVTLGVANTLGATLATGSYYLHVLVVNSYGNTIEFFKKIYINGLTDIGEGYTANLSIVSNDVVFSYTNSNTLDAGGNSVGDPTQQSYEILYDAAVLVPPTTPISGFTVVNPTVGSHIVDNRWWFGGTTKPAMTSYKTSNIIVTCQS